MKKILYTLFLGMLTVGSFAQDSFNCSLLYNWSDESIVGSWGHDNAYNEIWGYAADNREYAIIGTTSGTHIFDVTDPENSELIHFIDAALTGGSVVHRDYHDYQGYLYIVCDEGASTLQIVDMSGLPETVEVVYDSNALFSRAHNIYIDESKGMMYAGGGSQQLSVFSLENPTSPTLVLNCQQDFPGWSQAGYIHDLFVKDGIAYCNAGGNGMFVADFNDMDNPVFVGSLTDYTDSGYNHSGWLSDDGQIYALADETHGMRIKILDVSDLTDINEIALIANGVNTNSIVHNLIFKDNYLHISYYYDGYYVYDMTDPANPVLEAFYDTCTIPNATAYKGAWGVYPMLPSGNILVSDMQNGLYILNAGFGSENSVDENAVNNAWSVYPTLLNESNNLIISGVGANSEVVVVLHNELGQLIDKQILTTEQKIEVVFPELVNGIYFVTLQSQNKQEIFKIIK